MTGENAKLWEEVALHHTAINAVQEKVVCLVAARGTRQTGSRGEGADYSEDASAEDRIMSFLATGW